MIELKNVYFSYGKQTVLDNVSLHIANGQFVGLIGRNGAGKTTLLRIVLKLLRPQSGTIVDDFARRSFLSQVTGSGDLVFPATVKEVVSLGLKWKPFSFMGRKDWSKVEAALKLMRVDGLANRSIASLSGGEQQRVRLAKALISEPDILVMDEPTTGMDVGSRQAFLGEVTRLNKEFGKTILLVTHFYEDLDGADVVYQLAEGKVSTLDMEKKNG